uniref:Structure-specific endonuclease subunit SLX4 n=1 Tax=Caenorhabditis japonica TaxID=281687 RepID=A0A8R1I6U7_CAEJA
MHFEAITLSDDDDDEVAATSTKSLTKPTKPNKCSICQRSMDLWSNSRIEIHTKVCQMKRDKEKEKEKEKKAPKSKFQPEYVRIEEPIDTRARKRPRSYAVVELAPKKCKCEVVATLHSRFLDEFHFSSVKMRKTREQGVSEHAFQMRRLIEKLSRYEQLSRDMHKVLDSAASPSSTSNPNITLKCTDGDVTCPVLVLTHRTSLVKSPPAPIQIDKRVEVVKTWLTYVFTANIEWNDEQREDVMELARKYGPVGLENVLEVNAGAVVREEREEEEEKEEEKPNEDVEEELGVTKETETEVEKTPEKCVFTSDDPLVNFGKLASTPPHCTVTPTLDSFDEWSNQSVHHRSTITTLTPPAAHAASDSAPNPNTKPVFGSNVRILKTDSITPLPIFDEMDEAELKERMKQIGMRAKGKSVMIQLLKKAYTTLHPEVLPETPTLRPLVERRRRSAKRSPKLALNERLRSSDNEEQGGEEEDEDEEEEEGEAGLSNIDTNELQSAFLAWLRSDANSMLHEHILSLQPVSLEEMLIRLEKADGPLGRIGKAKLARLLDSLQINFQQPQKCAGVRRINRAFKKRF